MCPPDVLFLPPSHTNTHPRLHVHIQIFTDLCIIHSCVYIYSDVPYNVLDVLELEMSWSLSPTQQCLSIEASCRIQSLLQGSFAKETCTCIQMYHIHVFRCIMCILVFRCTPRILSLLTSAHTHIHIYARTHVHICTRNCVYVYTPRRFKYVYVSI